jgi:hypothetical protein
VAKSRVVSASHGGSLGPPLRILYIEDHAVFATNVINQFLGNHGVTVASGLTEARRLLETWQVRLAPRRLRP